jgi:tetratricopeptide (TPR) repeat protein
MANVHFAQGNLSVSESLHQQSLELHQATGFRRGQAEELGNLALIRRIKGDFGDAFVLSQAALQIDQEIGDRRGEAADWGNLGILYTQLGNNENARKCILKALAIDREIGYVQDELNHINNLAELDYCLGNVSAAMENYNQALRLNEQVGYADGVAHQLGNIGTVLVSIGKVQEGREYLRRALELNTALGEARARAADLASLGNACFLLGEKTEALEYLGEAVRLATEISDADLVSRALVIRGDIFRDLGQIEAGHDDYAAAVEQLERVRVSILEEKHQIGFFARDKAEVYERLIRILLVRQMTSSAFDVVQQAKSRTLLQFISRSCIVPSINCDEDLVAREQELNMKMNTFMRMADESVDETERLRLSAEIASTYDQLKVIWRALPKSLEEYVALRQGLPLSASDIKGLCAP